MNTIADATTTCPFCSEAILVDAIQCKHCQSDLVARPTGSAGRASDRATGGALGTLMLIVPLASTSLIWFWVGEMNLLQNPSSTLAVLGVGTIISTAVLAFFEAQQVGAGRTDDVDANGKKRSGPAVWLAAILMLWAVCFPAWLYQRSKYGLRNLLAGGILIGLLFAGSWVVMSSAIEAKKSEIRNALSGFSGLERGSRSPSTPSTPPIVTLAKYEQIKNGMTYEQVRSIVADPGNELSRSQVASFETVMYSWSNANGSSMNAMFQNGKLINKAQFALR